MSCYIGVDIGGTKCAVTLGIKSENSIHIIRKKQFGTFQAAPFQVLEQISNIIMEYRSICSVEGIGIACGGPLDADRGVILSPPNLPGWDNIEIVKIVSERFQLPVYLQNDANACAIAEWKYGAGRNYRNIIFLTFGTGIGAGLILDGKIYSGTNNMAGEVGHWRLNEGGPVGYGKEGAFEGYCSGRGIAKLAQSKLRESPYPKLMHAAENDPDKITAKLIGNLAESGDEYCKEIYARSGKMLGRGLALLVDALNPQVIIIGSIFVRSQNLLWTYAQEEMTKEALPKSLEVCSIVPAKLGNQLGDYAALTIAEGCEI